MNKNELHLNYYTGVLNTNQTNARAYSWSFNSVGANRIAENEDLNTLVQPGNYYSANEDVSVTLKNSPVLNRGFTLKVENSTGNDPNYIRQIIMAGINIYMRVMQGAGKWADWNQYAVGGYKPLWEGTMSESDSVDIPEIKKYNTYAIVSSAYPMALYGMRWGNRIMAFGIDCNASNGLRAASVILTISETKVTANKSKIMMMQFDSNNGPALDFTITNIYGVL